MIEAKTRSIVNTDRYAANDKTRPTRLAFRAFLVGALIIGVVVTLYPFWFMLTGSFKSQAELFSLPPAILPESWQWNNYAGLVAETPYVRWFVNSVLVTTLRIAISLFLCSLAGFALATFRLPYRRLIFAVVVVSIVMPFEAIYIPLYIMMTRIGWVNSYYALIVPWAASGIGIFLMRQYMMTIPDELIEAARVDGASAWRVYWQIAVPLAKPAFAALAIVLFLVSWTAFFWPLIVLTDPELFTLPIGLTTLMNVTEQLQRWEFGMAGSVIASLPLVIVFVVAQKYFVAGLTSGAVKN